MYKTTLGVHSGYTLKSQNVTNNLLPIKKFKKTL